MRPSEQPNQKIRFGSSNMAYKPYLYGIITLGLTAVAYSFFQLLRSDTGPQWLILAFLTILTSSISIKIPAINSKISIGDTLFFTNVLLFGVPAGVITAALDGLAGSMRARTRTRRLQFMLFNTAAMSCSAFVAGSLFFHLSPIGLLSKESSAPVSDLLFPLGVLAFTHYLVNSGSVAIIVALEKRMSILGIWKDSFLWTSVTYFAGVAAAAFIGITVGAVTPKVLGITVPVLLAVYFTYRTYLKKVDEVRSLAYYDSLTGLPNRIQFKEQLEEALSLSERQKRMLAVMFLDLDYFKRVNDTYGHGVGDLLLKNVASRLTASVRGNDGGRLPADGDRDIVIGRFGGDEFTAFIKRIDRPEEATRIAERFLLSLSDPFSLNGYEINAAATIGISIYPFDGIDAETLLRNADAALYCAKENGRNSYHLYSRSINDRSCEKMSLENQLRKALISREFEIYYQPKLDIQRRKISGAEALIRWQHPTRGLLNAGEFIPLAEETGLIKPIGEWVLKTVCAQIRAWQRDGMDVVPVAVNLSPIQFRQADINQMIAAILKESSLNHEYLELELTETAIMEHEQEADALLRELRALGVKISIDDFGTGYSSLSRLKKFKLDSLKIDRSFITDCFKNPDDRAIITAVIAMARSLALKVVAEGVETEQQLTFLLEEGCQEIQGFYFCRPIPAIEFARLLTLNNGFLPAMKQKRLVALRPFNETATCTNHLAGELVPRGLRPTEKSFPMRLSS
jgi:diguanylate cyclase (GGDEF)-like protein